MKKPVLLTALAAIVITTIGTASAKPNKPHPNEATDFTTTEVVCANIVASCDPASYPGAPVDVADCVAMIQTGPVPVGGFVGMTDLEIFRYFFSASMGSLGGMGPYCSSFVAVYPG